MTDFQWVLVFFGALFLPGILGAIADHFRVRIDATKLPKARIYIQTEGAKAYEDATEAIKDFIETHGTKFKTVDIYLEEWEQE